MPTSVNDKNKNMVSAIKAIEIIGNDLVNKGFIRSGKGGTQYFCKPGHSDKNIRVTLRTNNNHDKNVVHDIYIPDTTQLSEVTNRAQTAYIRYMEFVSMRTTGIIKR